MPAKKKTSRRSPAKKTPAKKTARKAPAKKTAKRPAKKKTATAKSKSRPAGPREQAIAHNALKLVDQAAAALRKGIRTSADTSEKARLQAKQQAHTLLTKASTTLGDLLSGSASALHKVIGKI